MPRNGSGVYSLPAGTQAIPGQTIKSADFNAVTADLQADANNARPVSAGGTGASNETDARIALGAQPLDPTTTALAGVVIAADKGIYGTGPDAFSTYDLTVGGRLVAATTFTDPNADRLFGWDDSAGQFIGFSLGTGLTFNGTSIEAAGGLPRGYLAGLTIANNSSDATNDIDIAAGSCRDSTNTVDIVLASAVTRQLDVSWTAAGTGMRHSTAIANTTYHIYLACKANGADVTVFADTSAVPATALAVLQAMTGGSSYAYLRRIGPIVRSSGSIQSFTQTGDRFRWNTTTADLSSSSDYSTAISLALRVPTGISVEAFGNATHSGMEGVMVFVSPLTASNETPTLTGKATVVGPPSGGKATGYFEVQTNASGEVRLRQASWNSGAQVAVLTLGWVDRRGRDD